MHVEAAASWEQFRRLLEELCCEIRTARGEEMVMNLALKEDGGIYAGR